MKPLIWIGSHCIEYTLSISAPEMTVMDPSHCLKIIVWRWLFYPGSLCWFQPHILFAPVEIVDLVILDCILYSPLIQGPPSVSYSSALQYCEVSSVHYLGVSKALNTVYTVTVDGLCTSFDTDCLSSSSWPMAISRLGRWQHSLIWKYYYCAGLLLEYLHVRSFSLHCQHSHPSHGWDLPHTVCYCELLNWVWLAWEVDDLIDCEPYDRSMTLSAVIQIRCWWRWWASSLDWILCRRGPLFPNLDHEWFKTWFDQL